MTSCVAPQPTLGTTSMRLLQTGLALASSSNQENSSVANGKRPMNALTSTVHYTCAPAVASKPTEPSAALVLRTHFPSTPYKVDEWDRALRAANLFIRFIDIPTGFCNGFLVDFPLISHTQIPPNRSSFSTYITEFSKILKRELLKGRYIGPFSETALTALIGPFQSSPISIIPKPGRPNKFRIVQNFSFPLAPTPINPDPSINSLTASDSYPTTWGKFSIIFLLISCLPPGSEAATRNIARAYCTIQLHSLQWPAAVVRAKHDTFYVDTCAPFGASPPSGTYGHIADAGTEILRFQGIGPLDKWVDDHIFFRIRCTHLTNYNIACAK